MFDRLLVLADGALRAVTGGDHAARALPTAGSGGPPLPLDPEQRRLAGALMRVNHVGEVCARALYSAQAVSTSNPTLRKHFEKAAREETDHLVWTRQRLHDLGARPSLLNPLWYAGSFAIGLLAGRAGDGISLGFVVETERQVEQHLAGHLDRLPAEDTASRAVLEQMKKDEATHGGQAQSAGAAALPLPVRWAMRLAGKVMTTTAYRL